MYNVLEILVWMSMFVAAAAVFSIIFSKPIDNEEKM